MISPIIFYTRWLSSGAVLSDSERARHVSKPEIIFKLEIGGFDTPSQRTLGHSTTEG